MVSFRAVRISFRISCRRLVLVGAGWALCSVPLGAAQVDRVVKLEPSGRLSYVAGKDGDRVPDFSTAGYRGGGVPLPALPDAVTVAPVEGDDGARIQAALDHVAGLPLSESGHRGAVRLLEGEFQVEGQLRIRASGIVLRGSGEQETTLLATGKGRRTLILLEGAGERSLEGEATPLADERVPVGASRLRSGETTSFSVGDRVIIRRPSTAAWIEAVGMAEAPARTPYRWREGTLDLEWDREIIGIKGDQIQLDAALTTALEPRFGGGTIQRYRWPDRIREVGVENLRLESEYDTSNPHDEEHAWIAIQLDRVENAWVLAVEGRHFVSSLVDLGRGARAVTVRDCVSRSPVSEDAGYRRIAFHSEGQLTLFENCLAYDARHAFAAGNLATGPNVFLDCRAVLPGSFSGSIGRWASGLLFDNVHIDGNALRMEDLGIWNQGVGWNAANSMIWQSSASFMGVSQPPTATNWATAVWAQFEGDGLWMETSQFAKPKSLYRAQLRDRLGKTRKAEEPITSLSKDEVPALEQVLDAAAQATGEEAATGRPLSQTGGWLVANGQILHGSERPIQWWRGSLLPARAREMGSNITRFVPGRSGPGLTDDLGKLTDAMLEQNEVSLRHHYGLWYDRRRDDHEMTRRMDANVWPPFFELPWARSGRGESWNGLSRYDLSKFNPWYFRRLERFAHLAREKGLVLINEMYFQHNILESGAHWVDFPWRPENALQETGFPEPPPFDGDTIVMADLFYDVSHPLRREMHRLYIRKSLENLAEQPNVIHTVSAEFTGPLEFVEFWLDEIAAWQGESGRDPLIALSTTKDVQDAILADPRRADRIDVIDFSYWFRTDSGEEFAPRGGENLAPRQHRRKWRGGGPSAASIAAMVKEYRVRFPDKAIITSLPQAEGWSLLAAGGSLPSLPADTDERLLEAVAGMAPTEHTPPGQWTLENRGQAYFAYRGEEGPLSLDLTKSSSRFEAWEVMLGDGSLRSLGQVEGGREWTFDPLGTKGPRAVLLTIHSN